KLWPASTTPTHFPTHFSIQPLLSTNTAGDFFPIPIIEPTIPSLRKTLARGRPKADKGPSEDLAYHCCELCLRPQSE
ncbi:hypothetical protein LINPERHAP2_LOCUS12169, partial [Linum perenne]